MKAQFEFTTAELAEVASRNIRGSPLVRRWRIRSALAGAFLMGVLAFALVPGETTMRLAMGVVFALLVFGASIVLLSRPGPSARTEQLYREKLGGSGPFTCEVELTAAGVVSRQLGQELFHPWANVASVTEIPGAIEFVFTPIGSLLVRDRAFQEPQARANFLAAAREHVLETSGSKDDVKRPPVPSLVSNGLQRPAGHGVPEREYFVAWLLFFICVSVTSAIANAAIGAIAAAMLKTPGAAPPYTVHIFAGLILVVSACLSYLFFRLFTRRLVARMQASSELPQA